MASSSIARLASGAATGIVLALLAAAGPVVAQSDHKVTICQATGSPANPYVFTTIDPGDLPEHLARGDYRASSIADCSSARATETSGTLPASSATAAPVAQPAATAAPVAQPAPTSQPVQQQGVAAGHLLPDVSVSQLVATATTTAAVPRTATPAVATATAAPARATATGVVSVAGAQATPEQPVSTLPRGGGGPDRPLLVLVLLGLLGAGLGLRRLGRADS
jgi:hypothetical protein